MGNLRFGELCPGHVGFWRFRSLRRFRDIVTLVRTRYWFRSFRDRGGFVLSYRWLTLGVGFGLSVCAGFVLSLRSSALCVGFRRYPETQKALTSSPRSAQKRPKREKKMCLKVNYQVREHENGNFLGNLKIPKIRAFAGNSQRIPWNSYGVAR